MLAISPDAAANMGLADAVPTTVRRNIARIIRAIAGEAGNEWGQRHWGFPLYRDSARAEVDDGVEYGRAHATPLLKVLSRGMARDDEALLHIYRHERMRFVARNDDARAELAAMLDGDEESLLRAIRDKNPALADVARGLISGIHQPLRVPPEGKPLRMAFVGDCVMTEIQSFLRPQLHERNIALDAHHLYFSARLGAELATDELESAIATQGVDLIALSFLTLEGLPVYTSLMREAALGKLDDADMIGRCDAILSLVDRYLAAIREKTNTPIILHGCCGLPLGKIRRYLPMVPAMSTAQVKVARRLNDGLAMIAQGVENTIFLDEWAVVADAGARQVNRRLLPRTLTHGALFHPSRLGLILAHEYTRIANAYRQLSATKLLLVDFDNTLWDGVMADGEVVHNVRAQTLLRQLKEAGVLLVSLSKNDPRNIRWDEMVLKEDDFVLHKISWDTKPQSVLEVAHQLNLGANSFVLIDDNPVERELVTATVPGVTALDPLDPGCWDDLSLLLRFPATRQTEEASRRTAMYREAAQRREAQTATVDYATMMQSLELKVGWRRARPDDVDRAQELASRTNQFNTTTIRYTANDMADIVASPDKDLFVATLADKFGALGVVGAVITRRTGDEVSFENVVMSCRAMGFGLETALIRCAMDDLSDAGIFTGRYIATERNAPCAGLFEQCGFADRGDGVWALASSETFPPIPEWLAIERG